MKRTLALIIAIAAAMPVMAAPQGASANAVSPMPSVYTHQDFMSPTLCDLPDTKARLRGAGAPTIANNDLTST